MLKRRSKWFGGTGALLLVLSLSGVVAAAPALAEPAPEPAVVDTTATFEDLDGNGVDDDCQEAVVADPIAAEAADLAVDANADGVISTTEAAHSDRIGGKNCNHGGYVSWIAHQDVACEVEPTVPETEPAVVLIVAEPEVDACAEDASGVEAVKAEKAATRALRAVLKAERKLARETAKAERTATRDAAKAERTSARDAKKAERAAAKAAKQSERNAAKTAKTKKGGH